MQNVRSLCCSQAGAPYSSRCFFNCLEVLYAFIYQMYSERRLYHRQGCDLEDVQKEVMHEIY